MMPMNQVTRLLSQAAARDARVPSQAMAIAWQRDLDGLEFDECSEAIDRHFRQPIGRQMVDGVVKPSSDYLVPGHIQAGVRIIRDEKRRGQNVAAIAGTDPGAGLTPEQRAERIARHAAACLEAGGVNRAAANRIRDNDDPVRDRALARAATEKRERERVARNPALAGLVAKATAHIERPA